MVQIGVCGISIRAAAVALALVLSTAPMAVRSQEASSLASVHPTVPPVAQAMQREQPVVIDGLLNEEAWQQAAPITEFRQYQPREGATPSVATEVRILFDAQALYIGARMREPSGAKGVHAPLARRDQLLDANGNNGSFNSLTSDKLVVILDPYHNHLDQALFEVNPAGVRGDQLNGDDSWDPVWEAAAHVDSLGWTAEMRIPYSQLRFSRSTQQEWGMQIWRYEDRLNERDMWAVWRRNEAGGPAFFGHLDGLTIGDRPRQLELLPYVVARGQLAYTAADDPFHGNSSAQFQAGGDLKYLLTSNLTLDATFNPDFGQVEVDPATLNLSAYETFYQEKRPFFIAGSSAFSFGGFSCIFCSNVSSLDLFYSRRIGRQPQLNDYVSSVASFEDMPENTTILGAVKITGRTNSGYTVGLLDAVTNEETAKYTMAGVPSELSQTVEPLSNYFVGRVKKDLNRGTTTIGMMLTSTTRRMDDSLLTDRLRSHAEAAGFDWSHTWHHHDYSWTGNAALANVAGSTAAILSTQQSSAHYFQRPDRRVTSDGLFDTRYDSQATTLRGYGFYTRLAKDNGNWLWEVLQNWRSPGFEVNDISFLDRADYKWMGLNLARQWTRPTRWYRNIFTSVGGQQQFNYDGLRTDLQAQAYYGMQFANYWNLRSFFIWHPMVEDDRLTRGGPVVQRTGYDFGHLEVSTDARRRVVADLALEAQRGLSSGLHSWNIQPGVAFKPAPSIFIQLSPTIHYNEDSRQYVTAVVDPTAALFYGSRYVFGYIASHTVSLDTRVNWTFTPTLTLQLFVQPFVANGAYRSFGEFAAPRNSAQLVYGKDVGTIAHTAASGSQAAFYTVDPDGTGPAQPFTFDDPDFTSTSLRGNAVLRWEYRPGSTVFFVWTQERSGTEPSGNLDFGSASSAMFSAKPTNIFLVKLSFWIGR